MVSEHGYQKQSWIIPDYSHDFATGPAVKTQLILLFPWLFIIIPVIIPNYSFESQLFLWCSNWSRRQAGPATVPGPPRRPRPTGITVPQQCRQPLIPLGRHGDLPELGQETPGCYCIAAATACEGCYVVFAAPSTALSPLLACEAGTAPAEAATATGKSICHVALHTQRLTELHTKMTLCQLRYTVFDSQIFLQHNSVIQDKL